MKKDVVSTIARRVGMPIYIPLVALICSFLLIGNKEKRNKVLRRYFYMSLAFIMLVLGELLVRYSGFSRLHTISYFLLPIILMPFFYILLWRKITFEKR